VSKVRTMAAAAGSPLKKATSSSERTQNIQCFVRVRPLNSAEKAARSWSVLDTPGTREVVVKEKANSSMTKTFNFDRVFGAGSNQQDVYKAVVGPLVKQVLQGYNCTVFAYGQTGTGKTYTMEGLGEIRGAWEGDPNAGIIPRSLSDLFDGLRLSDATEWGVRVSFLELYNEEIFDLLSGNDDHTKLRLYEDGQKRGSVIIQGLEEVQVRDKREVFKILERGSIKRQTAETKMNANSSRSHTVFTVTVFVNQQSIDGEDMLKIGKLNLVDLAGSENIARSGAVDKRAREAGNINQSLLTLGRVITSLVERKPHIPYRESKLTRLLQDSLGGRTKTSIIATVSPAAMNLEETLSTLDYAHRAKKITNRPELNQTISKKEKLLEYHREIDQLKSELQAARDKDGVFLPKEAFDEQNKERERQTEEIKALTKELKAKEQELEHFMSMFEETKAALEETSEDRDKTKRALDCTRTVLHKTESDKQEQVFLVKKHLETECKLSQQAQLLLTVSDEASQDLKAVHDKVDRQRRLDEANAATTSEFRHEFGDRGKRLESLVSLHVETQTQFCSELREKVAEKLQQRAQEKTLVSSTYTDTVTKLVETMSHLERLLSDKMYKEQSWVEQLLKRMRNEADTQSQLFHTYLVEQLLSVSNAVLAAVKNQESTLQTFSSKVDKTVGHMNEKVDVYLDDQQKILSEQSQERDTFLNDLVAKNAKLSQQLKAEQEASAQYRKKSQAFMEQMGALFAAKQKAEEEYITARNESAADAVKKVGEVEAAADAFGVRSAKAAVKAESLKADFERQHKHGAERLMEAKSKAVEQLGQDAEVVSQAVDRIKTSAESFVNAGKDGWNNHYEKTETELREKSDDSSAHVKETQALTAGIRGRMLESQAALDTILETQRRTDEGHALNAQGQVTERCQETKDFGSAFEDHFRSMSHALSSFVSEGLKQDTPSGRTPMRVNREFPRAIVQGTPDDQRLEKYRSKRSAGLDKPLLELTESMELADNDSVFSMSTVASEVGAGAAAAASSGHKATSGRSSGLGSASTQLSRENSMGEIVKKKASYGSKNSPVTAATSAELENGKENVDMSNKAVAAAAAAFARPKSKLPKRPQADSASRSRSNSKTRNAEASVK